MVQINESGADPESRVGYRGQSFIIESTPYPRFNCKQEIWADFKRILQELMKASIQGKVLETAQINIKFLVKAKRIKAGIMDPKEAWSHLDKRYSNKKLVVLSGMQRLTSFRLPLGPPHLCKTSGMPGRAKGR